MLLLGMDGAIRQISVDICTPQAVVLPHPDRRQLPGLDEPVDGHVGNTHKVRDLADGQQRLAEVPFRHPVSYPIPAPGVFAQGCDIQQRLTTAVKRINRRRETSSKELHKRN